MVCRSRLVLFYFKEKFCFARVGKSRLRDTYRLKRFEDFVEKIICPVIFDTDRSFIQ